MADSKIKTKLSRRKMLRKRGQSDGSESDEESSYLKIKLEETKLLQKLRERPVGINITSVTLSDSEECKHETKADPYKLESGGLVDMCGLNNHKPASEDVYNHDIGYQFSVETNKRDEDDDMLKYIEDELVKRRVDGVEENQDLAELYLDNGCKSSAFFTPEDAALHSIPDHLRISSGAGSEEMLSNQMLNGIPEIDLGIETKIKNIEATEEAKLKLIWGKSNETETPSQFVPSNMAVNFVQHNRFNVEESGLSINEEKRELLKRRRQQLHEDGIGIVKDEKATDDYHYEKFKKQFRRY